MLQKRISNTKRVIACHAPPYAAANSAVQLHATSTVLHGSRQMPDSVFGVAEDS